eukprot:CAMPEP_0184484046 /NCGR_PEP_ID=MMETSP0113_2-20130426/5750_1 /TAXON_ID=91329 /ORGANISM="Norrisiella sphaerica, Strain BC52" /LENGTH=326 /DNA_ID=CAMNT_0026864817 /DNA_START=151 /DNA_END=1131 /DNA_ORIENTATION=-
MHGCGDLEEDIISDHTLPVTRITDEKNAERAFRSWCKDRAEGMDEEDIEQKLEELHTEVFELNRNLVTSLLRMSSLDPLQLPDPKRLEGLVAIELAYSNLTSLPDALRSCKTLRTLSVRGNSISILPSWFETSELPKLRVIDLAFNRISVIPASIYGFLASFIDLSFNQLESIPSPDWEDDYFAQDIYLTGNCLKTFPKEIVQDSIFILHCAFNKFESLPSAVADMGDLEVLNVRMNRLESLPIDLAEMKLESLHADGNKFEDDIIATLAASEEEAPIGALKKRLQEIKAQRLKEILQRDCPKVHMMHGSMISCSTGVKLSVGLCE